MSDVKQVKVDNWGIYFLQRLKHFFNRTDYCDLTLQFQDNAQLKVHRLVLNACTEYFELLERTCEMYEDCLVMPEDLQADVVVPIVNFMYTGQLEFRMDALERLYQTSQIMNMPVLSKLLEAHRGHQIKNFGSVRKYAKGTEMSKQSKYPSSNTSSSGKRSYTKAFENSKPVSNSKSPDPRHSSVKSKSSKEVIVYRDKKLYLPQNKQSPKPTDSTAYRPPSPIPLDSSLYNKKLILGDPRPTRYELPEELDTDNVFDNSFTNISYTSQPLMIHPDSTKQYSAKKSHVFNEPTSSKKSFVNTTVDIVECKKISSKNDIFDDELVPNVIDDDFQPAYLSRKDISPKDPGQLFDQIIDNEEGPKVTIESKDKQASNLDHAKIISEVLKKYPHLVKSNKNIKLKILNTPAKVKKTRAPSVQLEPVKKKEIKEELAYTYETDVLDSKEAAKLISMGAENIKGPWICLICGTPGRALNFTSYYNFRRHLVEVHKEKPVSTICEHCGLKSYKRNYLLHHIYTKHGVPPPPQYHFPKCPMCDYIALTEGFLVKHKLTHTEVKMARCNVCSTGFTSTNHLLLHIQKTGHKQQIVMCDKKPSIQCSYCMKVFLRDNNFYCHLKTSHKEQALRDGLIEESDDEEKLEGRHRIQDVKPNIKHEHSGFVNELDDEEEEDEDEAEYKIHKRLEVNTPDGKKSRIGNQNINQKILNSRLNTSLTKHVQKPKMVSELSNEFVQEINSPTQIHEENIVVINDIEYVMKDNQLLPRKPTMNQESNEEYILSDYMHTDENDQRLQNLETVAPTTSIDIGNMHSTEMVQQPKMILKKSATLNQPIQIVVSNEEEYKALMASNHSIIFDDGNTNKTLTVLTAPQGSSLDNAGIELDNTQPNDMMIIQEDYPMNVSQAVSGDSKYVVVYSHAMEHNDPNKQYQIITPDMETQYVQNSAVLTQNYNTITTSTSMVNTNVMDTQIVETWPQSDHLNVNNQTTILVPPETELQTITEAGQANLKQKDDENSLIDLPEAQILHIPAKSTLVQLDPMQSNIDQSNALSLEAITNISPEQMVVDENQPNSVEESISIEVPSEAVNDKENVIVHETLITTENEIEEECHDMEIENIVEESPEVCSQTHPDSSLTAQVEPEATLISQELEQSISVQETSEMPSSMEHSEVVSEELNSATGENINTENVDETNIIQDTPLENAAVDAVPMNSENIKSTIIVETKEQIESLASEWSEDEYDAIPQEANTHVDKISSENAVTEEPELEESIENIQQEVQKQICDEDNSDVTTDVESFASQKVATSNLDEQTKPNTVIVNAEATQEKISSLLNDWEDNDSQEDNSSVNENGDDNAAAIETIDENAAASTEPKETIKVSKDEAKKDDKIKSLVSDWDDDDEDKES